MALGCVAGPAGLTTWPTPGGLTTRVRGRDINRGIIRPADMDLLIVTDRWDDAGGGREAYLAELRSSLVRRGHSVGVITRTGRSERLLQRDIDTFRRMHPTGPVMAARPAAGATHYQLHSGVYADAYEAERASYESSLRRWWFRSALRVNRRRRSLLQIEAETMAVGSGTMLMAFSNQSHDALRRVYGVSDERITLTRPGVDLTVFRPHTENVSGGRPMAQRGHSPVQLLFAGHNFVLKGLRWAMAAVAVARRAGIDAHLTVAGRGPIPAFASLARRLNIAPHVRFAGCIARGALADLYRESDLLIHPTFYDPFPRVIVEALASGVPVVTTRACGGAEILAHGRDGFIVDDPRQVEALAEAIAAVADPDRRAALGAEAARTGQRFDFESHAEAVATWLAGR